MGTGTLVRVRSLWARAAFFGLAASIVLLAGGGSSAAFSASAGKSHLFHQAGSSFDRWTGRGAGCASYYAGRYSRLQMFSPYADSCARQYGGALGYADVQAIYKHRRGAPITPRWVLKDAGGHRLFVRFGCGGGTCPMFAADIGSRAFQDHYIAQVRRWSPLYRGIFIDDVNWHVNVGNRHGGFVRPIDRRTGRPMTERNWRRYMADFLERIKAAFPAKERMVNTVWWRHASSLDDPDVRRGVLAATDFEIERGTADTFGPEPFAGLLAYVDRLHQLGLGVNLDSTQGTRARAEFEMAAYFLISTGRDMYSTGFRSCPENTGRNGCSGAWWGAYATDLGTPAGHAFLRSNGVYERDFQQGLVLLNPPGAPARTISFTPRIYRNLDGVLVTSVTLGGGQAAVLTPLL